MFAKKIIENVRSAARTAWTSPPESWQDTPTQDERTRWNGGATHVLEAVEKALDEASNALIDANYQEMGIPSLGGIVNPLGGLFRQGVPENILDCLEPIAQPLYSTAFLKAGVRHERVRFFISAVGQGKDSGDDCDVGVHTFQDTNLRRAGALATPQQFDATHICVMPDFRGVPEDEVFQGAYKKCIEMIREKSNLNLENGCKSYLRLPGRNVIAVKEAPKTYRRGEDGKEVRGLDHEAAWQGWLPIGIKPGDVPDRVRERWTKALAKEHKDRFASTIELTGLVPIHYPSEQQMVVELEIMGGVKLPMNVRLTCFLGGVLWREVA